MSQYDTVIPDEVLPADPTGQLPPSTESAPGQPSQLQTAARDTLLPVAYGGPLRMAGKLYTAGVWAGNLVLCILFCEGPVKQIVQVQMNDAAVPAGIGVTVYDGSQTTVDATLAAAIPGFNEVLSGVAYMVCTIPHGNSPGFPRFTAQVSGRSVYDPRDGTQSATVPSTWKYSDNPALILADFLVGGTYYGCRKVVDWGYVTTAANYCDQVVGGTEVRCKLAIVIDQKQDNKQWIDTLRGYIPGWVDYIGGNAVIIADMPQVTIDHVFDSTNIDTENPPYMTKRGVKDIPNVVQIGYTATDITPWAMRYQEANTNPTIRRKTRIDLPGIQRPTQAQRFATERLNHYQLEDVEGVLQTSEYGLSVLLGDRGTIQDPLFNGGNVMAIRITTRQDMGFGRWQIGFREYDPNAYSNSVSSTSPTNQPSFPDPKTVQAPTALIINEVYYAENVNAVAATGIIYQSRLQFSWTASSHAYPVLYRVQIYDGTNIIYETTTAGLNGVSPALQQGRTYTVNIIAVNSLGFVSAPLSGSKLALGKSLPPGNVPAITSGAELGGEVFFVWQQAADIDVIRYEWKYGPVGGFNYATATLIDRVDGLRARFKGIPVGTWRFAVKAIDSIGQTSVTETTYDLSVTSDANAFVQSRQFTNPFISSSDLIVNGDFSSSTGWALGSGGAIAAGKLTATAVAAGFDLASKSIGLVANEIYVVQITVDSMSAGSVKLRLGTGGTLSPVINAAGTYSYLLIASGNSDDRIAIAIQAGANLTGQFDNFTCIRVSNIQPIPYIENGVNALRWQTSVWLDQWGTVIPNPLSSGANPIAQYHTSSTSRFVGETWDLGFTVSAIWSATWAVTVINGSVSYYLETSGDGSTWTRQPGQTWQGTTRFIRPVCEALTVSTFRVDSPPTITLSGASKFESGQVIPSASVGVLVKFVNKYAILQDLQCTPINNGAASRNATADRIMIYPQSGLMISWTVAGANQTTDNTFLLGIFWTGSYAIVANDWLEYEIFVDPSCPAFNQAASGVSGMTGALDFDTNLGGGRARSTVKNIVDATGQNIRSSQTADLAARGTWLLRQANLAAVVGETMSQIEFGGDSDNNGSYKALIRNCRITNGQGGAIRQYFYPTSAVTGLQDDASHYDLVSLISGFVSNAQMGPANTFNAYLWNGATQVGGTTVPLIQYSVRGF